MAVTELPSTDLNLMGRHLDHDIIRGVVPVHKMLGHGVNCSLSSNNVLNPFTPFGDCSLIRSYVRKLVTELSGGVFGYLDSVLERHSFDEFGELI